MKVFIKMTQSQTRDQKQLELQERLFKAKTPKTYFGRSHIDCYYLCQQYKDYFEKSDAIEINCIPFDTTFFCGTVSFK